MTELKKFKFVTTLVLEFKKIEKDDEPKYSTFHSTSKTEKITNDIFDDDIDNTDVFESIYSRIIPNIQKFL